MQARRAERNPQKTIYSGPHALKSSFVPPVNTDTQVQRIFHPEILTYGKKEPLCAGFASPLFY